MTPGQKRELCQTVFGGQTADGKRMGVWITWSNEGKKWRYQIDGHLINATGPINKDWFVFGAATRQKDLVTESALH